MADPSSSNKEQALVIVVPVGLPSELHQCAPEYFLVVDSGERVCVLFIGTQFSNLYTAVDTPARGRVGGYSALLVGCHVHIASQGEKLLNRLGWCRFTLSLHSYWPLMRRDFL
jgi:hypothetical protein